MIEMTQVYWPLTQNKIRRGKVNNTFGYVRDGGSKPHWGWDFYAKEGTTCFAIAQGKIIDVLGSSSSRTDFGLTAVLEFTFNGCILYAAYCHLMGVTVQKGQPVDAGQSIGFTGNSGNAFNMVGDDQHLHFEIRTSPSPGKGGVPKRVDPLSIFGICPLSQTYFESYEWAMK